MKIRISLFKMLSVLLLACSCYSIDAQHNTTFIFSETTQSNRFQPARFSPAIWTIGLPSLSGKLESRPLKFNEYIAENSSGEQKLVLDQRLDQLEITNNISSDFRLETFSLSYRPTVSTQWTLHHALRAKQSFVFSDNLAKFVWAINTLAVDAQLNHQMDLLIFQEVGLAWTKSIVDNWSVGICGKLLNGMAETRTVRSKLSVDSNRNIAADYYLRGSSILEYDNFGSLNLNAVSLRPLLAAQGKNIGYAFDFGTEAQLNDWRLSVSLLDIGQVFWRNSVSHYRSEGTFGNKSSELTQSYLNNELSFETFTDSIRQVFTTLETNENYSSWQPLQLYMNLGYDMGEKWKISGVTFGEWWRGEFVGSVGNVVRYQLLPAINLGVSYHYFNTKNHQFGANIVGDWQRFQFFCTTNTVGSLINIRNRNQSNVQLGMSIFLNKSYAK